MLHSQVWHGRIWAVVKRNSNYFMAQYWLLCGKILVVVWQNIGFYITEWVIAWHNNGFCVGEHWLINTGCYIEKYWLMHSGIHGTILTDNIYCTSGSIKPILKILLPIESAHIH